MKEPENWIMALVAAVFGAGGVKMLQVWLENRRLGKKEFKTLLLGRIEDLEKQVAACQTRIGNMREQIGHLESEVNHLEEENTSLRAEIARLKKAS